jgi:hypothetical protein
MFETIRYFRPTGGGLEIVGGNRRRNVLGDTPRPAIRTGSSHNRIANVCLPRMSADDAVDRRQHRLHHARQIVRNRRSTRRWQPRYIGRGLAGRLGHDRVVDPSGSGI